MQFEQRFLISLFFTLVIELPIVFVLIRYFFKYKSLTISKILFTSLIATALTLPYLWFVLPIFMGNNRVLYIIIGEALVILIEAIIYNQYLRLKFYESFAVSLIANISSVLFGVFFSF